MKILRCVKLVVQGIFYFNDTSYNMYLFYFFQDLGINF
jgi:hypothetical protein